ncbi:MAG TPA: chromosome segregation protein SMC [Candidatus Acidoferrum sp.]|nr:chromosome segregation protein SMC [Candidatus Acidoferrum sp.]
MLKLRKVDIVGFKSFFERTHVTFSGTGLTCIVGPNGCGKSNIVDAISWVLGEQSHKSLRAERMSDCIFNGTAKRPPLGMAEVIIHLEDPELAEAGRFIFEQTDEDAAPQQSAPQTGLSAEAAATNPEGTIILGDARDSATEEGTTVAHDANATMEMAADPTPAAADADVITELPSELGAQEPPAKENPFSKKKKAAKPVINAKPGQVVIGRRLYRSGQSEYLINGRVARLRDVQEVFMGVGLGPDSYAIIEQGRIGQILSSRPADRRAIIEEAAGVTKYKTKKRLAEAKLEASKLNLNRVNDIVVEVEKQLASLKRQASKARRYAEIREQMRGLLRQVLASKARELDQEAERLTKLLTETSAAESSEVTSLAALEAEHEQLSRRIDELDAELRQNQNLLGQTTLELDRAENHIAFNRQRGTEMDARTGQLTAQLSQADEQTNDAATAATTHAESVNALGEAARAQELLVSELAARGQQLSVDMQLAEERIASLRQSSGELTDQLSQLQTEHAQAEASLALHFDSLARKQANEQQLLEESLHHRERDQAAEMFFQSAGERARRAEQEVASVQARISELRASRQELEARSDAARDAAASVRARRKTLEQVLNDRAYTADSVKKLFAANADSGAAGGKSFHAVGLLADYAEVAEAHEAAVEQFLRDELEYVVVETFDHARLGVSMLRDELGGRATFFVDSLSKLNIMPEENIIPFPTAEGVISRLDKLVEFKDPLGKAAKHFLPRLKSAWMVETASAAEKLAREYPAYCFVTPDGTTYQGRMVSGGRAVEAGPLGMKRELRALEGEFVQRERELAEAQEGLDRMTGELAERETALEQLSSAHVEAEKNFVAASHQRDSARAEMVRLSIELRDCQDEIARLQREVKLSEGRAAAAKSQREDATRSRATGEDEIRTLGDRVIELRQQAETHQQELAAKREELAAMAERLASAEALAARLEEERGAASARAEALRAQLAELEGERMQLDGESAEFARRATALGEEKKRLDALAQSLDAEWNQARNRTAHVDDAMRMARQKLDELRETRGHAEVAQAKNESEIAHLRESCVTELNAQPEDLMAEFPALLSGDELATADANYRDMKSRIDSMGPVNMMALEEYNECDQRFTFLTRERDDLLASISDTQAAITELDEVSRQKFEEAFTKINANFADAFRSLFGGGTGEMRLTEADSSGDAGIDVAAQPPGKRLQNVLLLSGGEKALTALALLIAIFRYQPSPFCILDEVDAPLDEANVGRFADMVAQMGAHTQFIVVTHNRRTMEMAPVMYGVTMQEPGVSKIVSVRWNEEGTQAANGGENKRAAAASAA